MAEDNKIVEVPATEDEKTQATRVNKRLQASIGYRVRRGFYEKWSEYQRFWESDQWPQANEKTKNFPRPVTNHYAEIIDMKVAGLCYEVPATYFDPKKATLASKYRVPVEPIDPEDAQEDMTMMPAELLVTMVEHVFEFNDIETLLEGFVRSAGVLGNGILHPYFNSSIAETGHGAFIGEIEVMEIDINDFHIGDPKEPSLQKQPYIIVTERRPRDQVMEEYEKYTGSSVNIKSIQGNDNTKTYDHDRIEQEEADYVNLIHYWEKKQTTEKKELGDTEVTVHKVQVDYYVICQDYVIREALDHYDDKKYPFANFPWLPRRKNFYAKPESADLINNQKELNRLQGIALMGAYQTGLPNILIKENFVRKDSLPPGPGGGIISDDSPPGQGWGVSYLQPPTIASYIPLLKDSLSGGMRDTSGVHEAWSGKAPSAHLNASAIMALQEAAGVRIRGIQRRYYAAVKELGSLIYGLMKQYYNENRLYKVYIKSNIEGLAWFSSEDFAKLHFDVKVTEGTASPYANSVVASVLEKMLESGVIDGDLYIKLLPREIFPKGGDLLEMIELRDQQHREMAIEQQKAIVDEVVAGVIEQAREAGVPITPELFSEMQQMIAEQEEKAEA